ncbi:MAG: hypothetical protein MUF44_08835 [Hydrogenophaga sp.]|jgi:hypothetical protein|nr:hypothetical protein [Hydrogenophaga sp.]
MVSVRNQLSDSIKAMLGLKLLPHSPEAVAAIRRAMLDMLDEQDRRDPTPLAIRLHQMHDAQGLWHARVQLYAHLCQRHSEQHAVVCLDRLMPLFRGRVPWALYKAPRPGGASGPKGQRGTRG